MIEQHTETDGLAHLRELGAKLEELKTSKGWQSFLTTAAAFHRYSVHNLILIWSQYPTATRVAGYHAWRKLGRQVRRGEHGIRILAPMTIVSRDDNGDEDGRRIRFKAVSVFDISQTEGDPLPELETNVWAEVYLPDHWTYEVLLGLAQERTDIVFATASASPNGARGWSIKGEPSAITLVEAEPGAMARTLLHELGHVFDPDLDMETYHEHRGTDELVAEAACWLVGRRLGIDTDVPTTHYLASWGASDAAIVAAATRVLSTADGVCHLFMGGVPL